MSLGKRLEKIEKYLATHAPNPKLEEDRAFYEGSLYEFTKGCWPIIVGEKPFIDSWHLRAMCEHLEATKNGEIKNLMILIPPRIGKTSISSIIFPAWMWVHLPHARFVCSSYKEDLALTNAAYSRAILGHPWFIEKWGYKVRLSKDQGSKGYFTTEQGGSRRSTGITAVTGFGGDFTILDDPNKPFETTIEREKTNDWVKSTWLSRLNPGSLKVRIVVQQRTHEKDVSGFLEELDGSWVKFVLPMEFNKDRKCKTIVLPSSSPNIWEDPRTTENELLCPQFVTPDDVNNYKVILGTYIYACQYQQHPAPPEGGLIKKADWKIWREASSPKLEFVLQSWDTGYGKTIHSAFSACTTWGLFRNKGVAFLMLLSAWRGKVAFGELLSRAERLYNNWTDIGLDVKPGNKKPDYVLIESKASGQSLLTELISRGIPAHGFLPDDYGDKMVRVLRITPYLEAGFVYVAALPPHYVRLRPDHDLLVEKAALFPNAESRDLVDSMTQAILYLAKEKKVLMHSLDLSFQQLDYTG